LAAGFPAQELASRGCVIHVPREPKGACYAHWEGPVGRVPRSGCAELGEARARAATSWALADVRSVSRNGLGNAVVRRPWQVENGRSLRLHIAPAKLNVPTAACYCPGGDRRGLWRDQGKRDEARNLLAPRNALPQKGPRAMNTRGVRESFVNQASSIGRQGVSGDGDAAHCGLLTRMYSDS
jgi:hypothetical protein